jgi:hypothetical protein
MFVIMFIGFIAAVGAIGLDRRYAGFLEIDIRTQTIGIDGLL